MLVPFHYCKVKSQVVDGHYIANPANPTNPANPASPAKTSEQQSSQSNDLGFDFEQPSILPSRIYWVKTSTGPSWNAPEKSGPLRSHIMREFHRQKRQENVSPRYSKGTFKKRWYKRLAPKGETLARVFHERPELDVSTKELP